MPFTNPLSYLLTRPVAKSGGRSARTTSPALKGHIFADCTSADILNIDHL